MNDLKNNIDNWQGILNIKVNSIYCISCSRIFVSGLRKIRGVISVEEFLISNKFKVIYDKRKISSTDLSMELSKLADRSGLRNQIILKFENL
jgi:hypothetical protein